MATGDRALLTLSSYVEPASIEASVPLERSERVNTTTTATSATSAVKYEYFKGQSKAPWWGRWDGTLFLWISNKVAPRWAASFCPSPTYQPYYREPLLWTEVWISLLKGG